MLFYKVTASITDEKKAKEFKDRNDRSRHAREVESKSADFNRRTAGKTLYFISGVNSTTVSCGIITDSPLENLKRASDYFKSVGIAVRDLHFDEITFSEMKSLLGRASREDFVDDADEILEQYGLDDICDRFAWHNSGIEYCEEIVEPCADKKTLYDAANTIPACDTLGAELDRIYAGKAKTKAFGHPVHYIIECDNADSREGMYTALFRALYDNSRIESLRNCIVTINPRRSFPAFLLDSLYNNCTKGMIVLQYPVSDDDMNETDLASVEQENLETIGELLKKHRNDVLSVICLPRACEKLKKSLRECLGSVSIVEIKEDLLNRVRSRDHLERLCKRYRIRSDKALFSRLEDDNNYLPEELKAMFDEWYDVKMKTSVYPQYKDVAACRSEAVAGEKAGSAYKELSEMIGLSEAKSIIEKAINYYKAQRIFKDRGISQDRPAMHMVFTGNPGTAKTTVARLFSRIMKDNGLLSRGHLVEVGKSDLVAKYVGWTGKTVKEKFKEAMGGVLFVDEAYALVEDRSGSFGDEAINTIVQEMENRREDLVVIFAGYPKETESFLLKNPGLRSRIAFHVPFADYDTPELCEIARLIAKTKGLSLSEGAVEKLEGVFEEARKHPDFGNGRYVRNVIELSKMNQATRILSLDPDSMSDTELNLIEAEDIALPMKRSEKVKRQIGFAG